MKRLDYRKWIGLICVCALPALSVGAAPRARKPAASATRPAGAAARIKLPKGAVTLRDIEYARVDGHSLKLDVYMPPGSPKPDPARAAASSKALPVVIWIHGGGWRAGSKDNCKLADLCGEGYAVVSVEYRLSTVAAFPAQIHDCKAAVRWVRAHAGEYGWNPDHVGVAGSSAGGHLVALLGTSGGNKELEGDVGGNLQYSSKVQAVADFCGPASFVADDFPEIGRAQKTPGVGMVAQLLGGPVSENADKARQASPVTYVSPDDPPFLIVHGSADPLVPPKQAKLLATALAKAGVPAKLHIVEGAGHACLNAETTALAKDFFDKQLRERGGRTASAAAD